MIIRSFLGRRAPLMRLAPASPNMLKLLKIPWITESKRPASHTAIPTTLPQKDEYFQYTRGRFVCNEEQEMAQRYVHFNVAELGRIAAEATGSKSCIGIEKYYDGMYNKVFLLTMDDGVEVVAKLPNPNAGRPHYTIASEVATMDFVRTILSTPVPRVLTWCSRAEASKVGAEYIIMEKVAGVTLDRVWDSMKIEDRAGLVKAVASYQKSWMSVSFEQLGSIYYARDLDEQVSGPLYTDGEGTRISNPKFAVGPTTGRNFNDDGRETIEFDRGPWSTVEDYHLAAGYRDIYCVKNIARLPKSPLELWGPGTYQPTREKKLKALQYYIGMIKYLLPVDQSIRSSCLWHEDLHHENILVNPQNPTEVISILDWQSTEVASLFSHARQPPFLNHDGPPMVGLERPRLPENFAQLDPAARKEARRIYIDSTTSTYYKTLLHIQNPRLYNAMVFQESVSFTVLSVVPRQLLLHGEAVYLTQTVELEKEWNELPGVIAHGNAPFPFNFSSEEKADFEADCEREHRSMCLVKDVQASMGDLYPDGWIVSEEKYDETKDALRQMKEQVIATYAHNESEVAIWEEHWPYDD